MAWADLRGADLGGAVLREADLQGADLGGVVLREADLHGAKLAGAKLIGADLRRADLRWAGLTVTYRPDSCIPDLTGAHYDAETRLPEGLDPDAEGMILQK